MSPLDPRWMTGFMFLSMGLLLLWITWRLWVVNPINRVFRVGPYVTEEGMEALVRLRLFFLAWGAFLATQGASSVVFWFIADRNVFAPAVTYLGSLASGFGVFATVATARGAFWLWRGR